MAFFQPLRTYRAVDEVVQAFARGMLSFLLITGNPGIGKTKRLRRQLGEKSLVIECTCSPFGVYGELARFSDCDFLALDDIDGLMSDHRGQTFLKALGQSERRKTVAWNTKAADREGLPRQLDLHCRVMMLANEINGRGANFDAVLDRAHCFEFLPTAKEVHHEVCGWQEKGETNVVEPAVVTFIGEHLPLIIRPSFRFYVKATELARAGLDWQSALVAQWSGDPKLAAAAEIVRLAAAGDPTLATARQRAERFEQWGHGVRSTYMEYQKKIYKITGRPSRRRRVTAELKSESPTFTPLVETPLIAPSPAILLTT